MDARLEAFLAKGKEYDVLGEKLHLVPFKVEDVDLLMNLKENPSAEDIKKLVSKALTDSGIPTTIEDTNKLSIAFLNRMMECIVDINGYKLQG